MSNVSFFGAGLISFISGFIFGMIIAIFTDTGVMMIFMFVYIPIVFIVSLIVLFQKMNKEK